ncbi:MAG: hypothetical protein JRJ54_04890 [Deltaproteobacteria bacterium]|nr:hypothetical protein [Deltaproteobacteria bacterium]
MNGPNLGSCLEELFGVILEERQAARALKADELQTLARRKEALLERLAPLVDTAEPLTHQERKAAEAVYAENLRNAYFLWSALQWVRQSMSFINDQISFASYRENGSVARARLNGALLSGRA